MKRLLLSILISLSTIAAAYAQMSDDQVVEYVKSGVASGKSQTQIGKELLARGVTQAQAERIKANYEKSNAEGAAVTDQALNTGAIARETRSETVNTGAPMSEVVSSEISSASSVFGHNIFNGRALTFEPNVNAATPEDYRLGPGDQVIIQIWGNNESTITQTISPEGRIYVSQVGPMQLSGLTIKAAEQKVRRALASKYSGLSGSATSVSVTLGNIRSIQVNVMGEVSTPGTYRLSSFSTVFNAIYRAGGVRNNGSLRAIRVIRGGEEIAKVDVYGYLFDGKSDSDISLQEGDVIIVPPYVNLVNISGNVKRPMRYELIEGETLETLIQYAGGFASDAFTSDLRVVRKTGDEREVFTVEQPQYASWTMDDGDEVTVGESLDRFANKIEVRGYVFRPGMFELGDEIATLKQLVKRAGGPTEDAFLNRAVILREKNDLSLETISVDLGAILAGTAEDVLLRKNDILVVSGIHELYDRGILTINGLVASPGTFPFAENTTIEDLILQAGGLLDGASVARVDVARRIVDPKSTTPSDTLGETFSFAIKDGFVVGSDDVFVLEPYDVVSVRTSPGFKTQKFVSVAGEVAFPGQYVLVSEGEKLSEVILRAGGVNPRAYVKGATLKRKATRSAKDEMLATSLDKLSGRGQNADSLELEDLALGQDYFVAIDLEKAIANPGSEYDVILREGDSIVIPEYDGTVKILGEVMFPNAVVYSKGKSLRSYIDAAGGYSMKAKKSKVYVIYANGLADRVSMGSVKIEPGCTIIVPSKAEKKPMTTAELMSMTTAATSMISMVTMLSNLLIP